VLWRNLIAEDLIAASEGLPEPGAAMSGSGKAGRLLPSIIEMINSILDLPEMLRQALRIVCETVAADRGFVLLVGEQSDELVEMADYGLVDDDSRSNSVQVSRTIVRWVTHRGETFQVSGPGSDPRLGSTQSMLDVAIRSLVCVPLRLRERVIGTIYLESRAAGAQFTEAEVSLVESFAHLIAVSIERSRLHDELRRSRDRVIGENLSLRRDATRRYSGPNIIGQSREIEGVLSEALRVAATSASVLITGEPGTGKELIARLIHYSSARADRPLLSLNCSALAPDLLDAELFGTERHIATGVDPRPGIFERAHGATLFLDEIGEMPPALQVKLLRVLQERTFMRVGGARELQSNFRLLSATNRDLLERIEAGAFRDDLYERIRQFEIHIPPLRERKGDIPILAEHFLRQFCEGNRRTIPRISEAFHATIGAEPWMNNIRQLENYVVRCAVLCEGDSLDPVVPPPSKEPRRKRRPAAQAQLWLEDPAGERPGDLKSAIEDTERRWILRALEDAQRNQRRAAAILGLKEATLRYKMRVLGITPTEDGSSRSSGRTRGRRSSQLSTQPTRR
jgi:Nif-specific regulatory protein